MTHDDVLRRLDDFVDGTLPTGEVEAVARHLGDCEPCRAELASLESLLSTVAALPTAVEPTRDLWPDISARLAPRAASRPTALPDRSAIGRDRLGERRPSRLVWTLAVAAMLLMAVTAAVTTLVLRRQQPAPVELAAVPVDRPVTTALVALAPTEQAYLRTADDLQQVLEQNRARLSPETIVVVERNLKLIDDAIAESRAALSRDPANPELAHLMTEMYRRKVDLLRQVVSL